MNDLISRDCISRAEAIKALGEEPEVWSGEALCEEGEQP